MEIRLTKKEIKRFRAKHDCKHCQFYEKPRQCNASGQCLIEENVAKLKSNTIKDMFYKEECKNCSYANETGTCFHICFQKIFTKKVDHADG